MEPGRADAGRSGRRLPRTRGDGPVIQCAPVGGEEAPPHPRGWTAPTARRRRDPGGSPAPAGMDPKGPSPTDGVTGLPRTRGDGPRFTAQIFVRETAPPHPRGWTPGPRTSYRARSGLPRTRGDRKSVGEGKSVSVRLEPVGGR